MAKYVPSNEKFSFEFDTRYTSPDGEQLGFRFRTIRYTPPAGDKMGFAFTDPYQVPEGDRFSFEFGPEKYKAPPGNKVTFDLKQSNYIAPPGNQVIFNLVRDEGEVAPPSRDAQYVYPDHFEGTAFGFNVSIRLAYRQVYPTGFNGSLVAAPAVRNDTQHLKPYGFDALGFSRQTIRNKNVTVTVPGMDLSRVAMPSIVNFHKNVYGKGFENELLGRPTIYNLRKYVLLNGRGIDSNAFGIAYMQGGVKYVRPGGLNALIFGEHKVINTKANQKVVLGGIAPPFFPRPNVSPQILTVRGILGTQWGSPYVQRNPSPKGWNSEQYGTAWVSRSPRFYTVGIGELTEFGSAKIFDAKQTVTITGVIPGGIFGDIQIRNLNFKIAPGSIEAPPLSDWTKVENTARYYQLKGFDTSLFGTASINNGTPSFTPDEWDSAEFGKALVAERIRRINTPGFSLLGFGRPIVTKTPQLSPGSIAPFDLGQPTLTLYTRYIVNSGRMMTAIGQATIGMAKRKLAVGGFDSMRLGGPILSHGVRELLAKGATHSLYGNSHQVWFRVRSIAPVSIHDDQLQYGHKIGGSQHIKAQGFDASRFGTRIVPESQDILASNFASAVFGLAKLHKTREILSVTGFATGGQQPADRWGRAKVYNSRQYIIQTFDIDSDLNPPKMQGWMNIINRNRTLGISGGNMALFGRAFIKNNATLMQPGGIDARPLGIAFIAPGIRRIHLQGIEPPYISGWTNLHNAAAVIAPKGFSSEKFGRAATANTRRYFPRIGNFESMVFGSPMISFKLRGVAIESRHSIGPIYIPIHKVELYSRYVETVSSDFAVLGVPALSIHKKIITPRWYLRDLFGDAYLRNVTPEVKTWGRNAEEFGQASIRTQWRNVDTFGDNAQLFGKPVIADRDRKITVTSFVAGAIGSALRVRGTSSPPLSTQYIFLNNVENRGEVPEDDTSVVKDGQGIAVPFQQVANPSVRSNMIRPPGYVATLFGTTDIYSNGILIENGIKLDKELGTPLVQLARRSIGVVGIENPITVGMPRLSPHTIYAVTEAPQQAKDNHRVGNLHAVNSDGGRRKPGEVFGEARVWMHNPNLAARSVSPFNGYGTPTVELKRRYVQVKGFQAYRFGWHSVGDGTQEITHRQLNDFAVFGRPGIALAKDKDVQVLVPGLNSLSMGRHLIEFFHRTIKPSGYSALAMGNSRGGTQYMPQSLHVGPRMPVIPKGALMEKFGSTYIGLKVRDVGMQGFDASVIGYDPGNFNARMRVQRGQGGTDAKPVQVIQAVGFDALRTNASNVKYAVHYIRPDGNSDQFRKGAF